jgi:mono/diheme cytochrome c family protein
MNRLVDLLFGQPLPHSLHQALLFATFALHFVLVLTLLGTAILAFYYFVQCRWSERPDESGWDRRLLKTFLPLEALAVVLGVGPLLLVQVGHTVSFFAAANILAPYWALLIVLMIVAFLALDLLEHHSAGRSYLYLALGIIGLACLLVIPGIFVAIFSLAENPPYWLAAIRARRPLVAGLGWFWLFRYLHVLGAAIIFGAVFHYLFAEDAHSRRKRELMYWIGGAIVFQVPAGLAMLFKLPAPLRGLSVLFLLAGIGAAAGFFMITVHGLLPRPQLLSGRMLAIAAAAVLLPMLLARQAIQDQAFFPLDQEARQNAAAYAQQLAPFHQTSLAAYRQQMASPVRSGSSIYATSCAFCHGEQGDGEGRAAHELNIPPAPLNQIRTTPAYLHGILLTGVHGSAMPIFDFYTPSQAQSLTAYLDSRFKVFAEPEAPRVAISVETAQQAKAVWSGTCATCHGEDGAGSPRGRKLQPPVPDFTQYSLTPEQTLVAIAAGYPGTMMYAYGGKLSADVEWALVGVIRLKRSKFVGPSPE